MPPSSTAPLREPASSRTAECPSRCQGDASWARASIVRAEARTAAAKPSAARMGTMVVMRRPYRLVGVQTIELLVMYFSSARRSLIDRTATQYQDGQQHESPLLYTSPSPRDGLLSRMP